MKTEQQLKNLREALVWWQTVPEANVYPRLSWFTRGKNAETNCNTVACFGGWCARWPSLIAQGLSVLDDGTPGGPGSDDLFGCPGMWAVRGAYEADQGFAGSDHALVTNRIRWALEHA